MDSVASKMDMSLDDLIKLQKKQKKLNQKKQTAEKSQKNSLKKKGTANSAILKTTGGAGSGRSKVMAVKKLGDNKSNGNSKANQKVILGGSSIQKRNKTKGQSGTTKKQQPMTSSKKTKPTVGKLAPKDIQITIQNDLAKK